MSTRTDIAAVDTQLAGVDKNAEQFTSPNSYFDLLGKVAQASFLSNADLNAYRQSARAQLYGETAFKPGGYYQMNPTDQAQIRNAPRANLIAGIQAANEAQASRGASINDFLATEKGRYADQQAAIEAQRTALQNKRKSLTENVQTTVNDGVATTFNTMTGEIISRVRVGPSTAGGSGSGVDKQLAAIRAAGYDIRKQLATPGFAGGGFDFYGPGGKKITNDEWQNGLLAKGIAINPGDLIQSLGSTNPQDYPVAKEPPLTTEEKTKLVTGLRNGYEAGTSGYDEATILNYLTNYGGYSVTEAQNILASWKLPSTKKKK